MSQLYVDNIKNRTGGAVGFPTGIVVTGVATFSGNVSIAGTLSYEDVTNVDSVGVVTAQSGIRIGAGQSIGSDSGTVYYYGDGSNLSNTGSTLSAASGTQRVVVTSQTSGTMTASATDADITFNAGNNTLYVGTASSSFIAQTSIGIGTTSTEGRDAGIGTAIGTVIFNASADSGIGQLEVYTGKGWVGVTSEAKATNFTATGGTIVTDETNNRKLHIFTSGPATFTVTDGSSPSGLDVLVVAGGGGGGGDAGGGGGGAGGLVFRPGMPIQSGPFTAPISIGGGGGGGGSSASNGSTGGDTTFAPGTPWSLTAKGGGGGRGPIGAGLPGGCGGGVAKNGGINPGGPATQPSQPGDSGTYGHGFAGGAMVGPPGSSSTGAAGGGGAGGAGTNNPGAADETGVPGGPGYQVPSAFLPTNGPYPAPLITAMGGIPTGSPAWRYFAGGGGGGTNSGSAGSGGIGGGGDGSSEAGTPNSNDPAPQGFDGRGGGGGGAKWDANSGGPGGDGIVIVSYPTL